MHGRKRSKRTLLAALALTAGVVLPVALPAEAAAAGCKGASANPAKAPLVKVERATLCLVNKKRKRHGVRRLRPNSDLRSAARGHSRDMERKNYFSHYSRNGDSATDRIRATGYLKGARSWATGENIGWGSGWRAKPKNMVRAWMRSSGHRAAILNPGFRHLGVGVARGAPVGGFSGAGTYTTDFGRR